MESEDVEELQDWLQDHEERIKQLEEAVDSKVALDKQLSMPEFVNNDINPSSHKEKILAIGYYLEAYEDQDSFTKNNLKEAYKKCGLSKTKNFSARASRAISEGWLDVTDTGRPRHWSVTKTGAEKVEEMKGVDNE